MDVAKMKWAETAVVSFLLYFTPFPAIDIHGS